MKKIDLLKSVSLFWDLEEKELGYISDKMVSKNFDNGNLIFLEESEGENLFFVVEGSVKITRLSKDGREVILAILNAGDFFGEMSLLDGESRSANVIALEKTEVLSLNREHFLEVLHEYPQIAIQLLKEMTSRLRKSDRQIVSLSLSDAEKRIANATSHAEEAERRAEEAERVMRQVLDESTKLRNENSKMKTLIEGLQARLREADEAYARTLSRS